MNGKWMVCWTKGWMWSISLLGDANDDVASSLLMLSSCMNKSLWLWPQVFNIRTGNHRNTSYIKEISIHWNYFFYDFPGVGCFVCCLFCLRHHSFYSTVSLSVIISTVVCYSSLSFPIRVFSIWAVTKCWTHYMKIWVYLLSFWRISFGKAKWNTWCPVYARTMTGIEDTTRIGIIKGGRNQSQS